MNQKQLHNAILEEAAIYFGWESFKEYRVRRSRQAKKLINQVYHLSLDEKHIQLNALRSVADYEKEIGEEVAPFILTEQVKKSKNIK